MKIEAVELAFLRDAQQPGGIDRIHNRQGNSECSDRDNCTANCLGYEHLRAPSVEKSFQCCGGVGPVGPDAPYLPQANSPSESVPQMPQIPGNGKAPMGSSRRSPPRRYTPR